MFSHTKVSLAFNLDLGLWLVIELLLVPQTTPKAGVHSEGGQTLCTQQDHSLSCSHVQGLRGVPPPAGAADYELSLPGRRHWQVAFTVPARILNR